MDTDINQNQNTFMTKNNSNEKCNYEIMLNYNKNIKDSQYK